MKQNIYQKLHKACCEAGAVKKADKVAGMKFNPLLHDSVQTVAMEALLSNGLYPVCTYENQLTDSFIMTTCTMRIHDIEKPEDSITIAGTSALGNLDKFGSGNSMSYAKKYAFLNALNLKTGMDSEDGYEAKPFKANKESNAKANDSKNKRRKKIMLTREDIKVLKELVDLAIDTRTSIESNDTPFLTLGKLQSKLTYMEIEYEQTDQLRRANQK
jgi:hypothetical protein